MTDYNIPIYILKNRKPRLPVLFGHDRILSAVKLGARLMVGRLTLDQLVEVRILCPQHGKHPENGMFSFISAIFQGDAVLVSPQLIVVN
jgi:hypothetical protein